MFEEVRKPRRAKSIFAYIIFGAICLVFVFLGMAPDQFGVQTGGTAAMVNNEVISVADFREELARMEQRFPMDSFPEAQRTQFTQYMRSQALQSLISRRVLFQSGRASGLQVSDQEVAFEITEIPAFKEQGVFSRELYSNYLRSTGQSAADFERKVRMDLLGRQASAVFEGAALPISNEPKIDKAVKDTELKYSFIQFTSSEFEKNLKVDPSEISRIQSEETEKLQSAYESRKKEWTTPEQVRARHILIRATKGNKNEEETARTKIAQIQKRLETEKFEKIAQELSDDPSSKEKGGDLGFFEKGRMVPEFEKVAFSIEAGQLSEPVQSDFGFHLIRVEEKKPQTVKSFDEVKEELAKAEARKSLKAKALDEVKELSKNGKGPELEARIKGLGFQWSKTQDLKLSSKALPGIGEQERVYEQLVKNADRQGLVPNLVESGGKFFLLKVEGLKLGSEESLKPEAAEEQLLALAGQRGQGLLSSWVEAEMASSKIEKSGTLIAPPTP